MALTPPYATLVEAEAAALMLGTALANKKFTNGDEVQDAWICLGYGLSLGFPLSVNHPKLRDATMLPSASGGILTWLQLLQQILVIISGMIPPTLAPTP